MNKISVGIIGGGISGLAAGHFLKSRLGEQLDLTIFEKEDRLGGTIGTTRKDGYLADWGPNGFLDREPLTLEFISEIGLGEKLYPSNTLSEKRFIYRNRKLWEISANPIKFMKSGLLSPGGRARIALEYFVPRKSGAADESIFAFVARRIGREAAETLIDPMVSGIYGGDAEKLSLGACFPVMEQMERDFGGLIKAMIKKRKDNKKSGKKGGPAGPSGHLTSFRGGLFTLVEHLEKLLSAHIRKGVEVRTIERRDRQILIDTTDGIYAFDQVIIATPSYVAAGFLRPLSKEAADDLADIPYSNLAVACQGYKIEEIGMPLDGFGFLVPHNQRLDILGSIWTSVIFPEQTPEGHALFRTMLGGARNNSIIELGEERLGELAHENLSKIMGIKAKPSFQEIIIWKDAIPQYTLGHRDRLKRIEAGLDAIGRIHLAGNAYTGIGLNDAIKRSHGIAEAIIGAARS
jgi:oxygen-dependent protoporphyrinogen oxidase